MKSKLFLLAFLALSCASKPKDEVVPLNTFQNEIRQSFPAANDFGYSGLFCKGELKGKTQSEFSMLIKAGKIETHLLGKSYELLSSAEKELRADQLQNVAGVINEYMVKSTFKTFFEANFPAIVSHVRGHKIVSSQFNFARRFYKIRADLTERKVEFFLEDGEYESSNIVFFFKDSDIKLVQNLQMQLENTRFDYKFRYKNTKPFPILQEVHTDFTDSNQSSLVYNFTHCDLLKTGESAAQKSL